ncbi:type II toxin-antitoxin system RelE/ParE family toxin [Terasakiella sp. A23]|uniref:type II toxin-antitoxin system RelE/ParE family toxin n=1 Tax=Terasakiella sp. FCG-A23 TaxID=3080561 RepID=UPI0029551B08|nr:type II toxin-antitoxin system RelE/ParE family toxin [Terasakiella sp. A23]MDV7341818.1 type II toxin-antitoxin system RelE/ParE family toxin [Terasakiella sp. A23]
MSVVTHYTTDMIKSFSDKCTEQIFNGQRIKRIDADLQKKVLRRLRYIHAANRIDDLRIPPSNKLEKKEGKLRDFYAIWVDKQWRIIFKWIDNEAHEVSLIDYH